MPTTTTAAPLPCSRAGVHRAPRALSRAARRRRRLHTLAVLVFAVIQLGGVAFAAATFFGRMHVLPVLSGSMAPAYRPGDAVVTRPEPVSGLHRGQIVAFVPPGERVPYAHRVTGVSFDQGRATITTRGDANPAADPWHATLQGERAQVVVAVVPKLGYLLNAGQRLGLSAVLVGSAGLLTTLVLTRAALRRATATR